MNTTSIIQAIDAHAARFNLKPSTIGQMAVSNRHVHANLMRGCDIQIGTAERILSWIETDAEKRIRSAETSVSEAS